ncbi:MAG: DegT/DnrJ/EryC1/StrS family aminotransferase, partial [Acidobacteriaceae bacterium]|nr:DegT/DnrJ/EryC1/StrS family aminotransferase [Acidobacteriaceae bacterium]
GNAIRTKSFPPHPIIGEAEKKAVLEVLESGKLSTFLAVPGEYFGGGKKIREFEKRFADYHGVRYAVAFNSATAALHAAVVATGVQPGEEVIVPPYTFTSTASSVLMQNAVPVFADVDDVVFGLDVAAVEKAITPLTRAIIVVHLFGHPANLDPILDLAKRRGLRVIEDCAQAPGARYQDKLVGTFGACGIFSFTENKNITTGEGGMLITDDLDVAEISRMVRNHGEVIQPGQTARTYNSAILGWNYRMTEMEAALGIVQFDRMEELNQQRRELADHLSSRLGEIEGLRLPVIYPGAKHAYYIYAIRYDEQAIGVPRDAFVKALNAEGIPFGAGYVRPLYLTTLYQERRAFAFVHYQGSASYEKGLCPVAERLHERELILTGVVRPPATFADMDDIARGFEKVLKHKNALLEPVLA